MTIEDKNNIILRSILYNILEIKQYKYTANILYEEGKASFTIFYYKKDNINLIKEKIKELENIFINNIKFEVKEIEDIRNNRVFKTTLIVNINIITKTNQNAIIGYLRLMNKLNTDINSLVKSLFE